MLKDINRKPYIVYGSVAAVLYSVAALLFLHFAEYTQSWLLFVGNFLFMVTVVCFLFAFNHRRHENAGSITMLTAGFITTGVGTALACLLCVILLFAYVPDIFQPGVPEKVLEGAPRNTVEDKTSGLTFMLFSNAILGNVFAGMFVSTLFPFAMKKDQVHEKVPRRQAEL